MTIKILHKNHKIPSKTDHKDPFKLGANKQFSPQDWALNRSLMVFAAVTVSE